MAAKHCKHSVPYKQHRLQQLIECPVCLNELQDPRMLSCHHALCCKCVKDYKNNNEYDKELPCPVCRKVTTIDDGDVENLPKFFFMNELKEVVTGEEDTRETKPEKRRRMTCSTGDCNGIALHFCTTGCQYLCEKCNEEHKIAGFTKSHHIITSEKGEEFTKSNKPPYPPWHPYKHQMMNVYCRTCKIHICATCRHLNHLDHDCMDIDKQAELCRIKLEQIYEDTNELILHVKRATGITETEVTKAYTDIDYACVNVLSTFRKIHKKLDKEKKKMLSDLQEARKRVKITTDVIADSQKKTLVSLENMKSCQTKLAAKDSIYDYVTVTDSMQKDVENHFSKEVPVLSWSSQLVKKSDSRLPGSVKVTEGEVKNNKAEVKETSRIRLDVPHSAVVGMVVYRTHVYIVHQKRSVVYSYKPDGSLSEKYEHKGGEETLIQGMCLMMVRDTPMLVISDGTNKALVWVMINDDLTMKHHHTQQLKYRPGAANNDRGALLVCDGMNHRIHRYTSHGQLSSVVTLLDDVTPRYVTRHAASNQYVITDWQNHQIVMADIDGHVKKQYKDELHGLKLDKPYCVLTDHLGRFIIGDIAQKVLLMSRDGKEVKQRLQQQQHVKSPGILYMDSEHHRLYISGKDNNEYMNHVFIFKYTPLTGKKTPADKIKKMSLRVEI